MNSKKIIAPLIILVVVFGIYYFSKGSGTPKNATVVHDDGSRSYVNKAVGLSFDYPLDWTLADNSVHGDVEGAPFTNSLSSISQGTIDFFHSPTVSVEGKSYDNISIKKQMEAIDCTKAEHCEKLTNKNEVEYFRFTSCQMEGCFISAVVPTGKYIMTFIISADGLLKASQREPVFKQIVDSIELI